MTDPNDNLRAARLLAGILYTDTGVDIEPAVLCAFINDRWDRVAPLAHRVHKSPDVTKGPGTGGGASGNTNYREQGGQ